MKRVRAVHTVTKSSGDVAGTVGENQSDASYYKLLLPLKAVDKLQSDIRSEIVRALTHLGVMTRTEAEAMVENLLTKWINGLQSQMVKTVESTFEGTFRASYFKRNNDFKSAMFNFVEEALGKVVPSVVFLHYLRPGCTALFKQNL